MAYSVDILDRRSTHFVFWLPALAPATPPLLLLGTFAGSAFQQHALQPLVPADGKPGLWLLDPNDVRPALADDTVYHYWFRLSHDSDSTITDPMAFTVDYGCLGLDNAKARSESVQPPAVVRFRARTLWPCDVDGADSARAAVPPLSRLPSNNHLVLYELPTSWARAGTDPDRVGESGGPVPVQVDVGTFADVTALLDAGAPGEHYGSTPSTAILQELGINALELLPPADAKPKGDWGYATAHYFAPDYDLGTASQLAVLAETAGRQGVRLFADVVMAFGHDAYGDAYPGPASANVFHIDPAAEPDNPDSYQAGSSQQRDGFGGRPWRYIATVDGYDPESGTAAAAKTVQPAWVFHKAHLARWMTDFAIGGLRLDSINNIASWDFVRAYRERAWALYRQRYGGGDAADPSKFFVIGEELSMPLSMLASGCVDALWNENWQQRARAVVLGEAWGGSDNFEWTVRKLVDCRLDRFGGGLSFADGAQAVNYLMSHDIEGYRKNRLYDFFGDSGLPLSDPAAIGRRALLAFVLLLTSVGVPMIFAGEEFADQQDQSLDMARKQTDPVNYGRKNDGAWRQALFGNVARLTALRTACPALGVDDTDVIHVDASRGGRVMAWVRGRRGTDAPVVVVANFTDDDVPGEYVVPGFPDKNVAGWREVTRDRDVPADWIGREPLYAWEAKVYTYWRA